ncbi:MAG TPA: hypothetical protein EYQ50_27720 [Verrucomicrobiales bacterium]|nr:hypothetical protein [Verrucomicrobiales bacterium]
MGRLVAGLDTPQSTDELRRADTAPRLNRDVPVLGDGTVTISDWVQAGRYVAGLDAVTPSGGPTQ